MVTIKSAQTEVVIDTLGAQMQSLKYCGKEYLWQGDKLYWTGRSPVLFPIVGGLRNNMTVINNRIYTMKRHGLAKISEFLIAEQSDSSVTFALCSSLETLQSYPFPFEFKVTYTVKDNSLTVKYNVKNTGESVMPFALGGHPAIKCPINDDEQFEDYCVEFECAENASCPTVSMETGLIDFNDRYPALDNTNILPLQHKLFYADAMIFDNLKSKFCRLYGKKSGNGVKMDFSDFKMLGIWSAVNDAPFVCLEPWIGCATTPDADDMFESKRDLMHLNPGDCTEKTFSLELF